MKKKLLCLLVLVHILALTACGVETPPETSAPVTTAPSTEPSTAPTTVPTEPTTEPTEPATEPALENELPWLLADRQSPSYEDFFSQDLPYNTVSYEWLAETEEGNIFYNIRTNKDGFYITKTFWDVDYQVPNTAEIRDLSVIGADGRWGYLESDEGILRLDLLTGETSLLVANENLLGAYLMGYDVLYYAAMAEDGTIGIYRLYLPDMTLDTMYEGIALDVELGGFSFSAPTSTLGPIIWTSLNPEMVTRVTQELRDPNSPYRCDGTRDNVSTAYLWDDPEALEGPGAYRNSALWVCWWIQQDTGIHTFYKCTYDCVTGTLTEDTGVIDGCWFGSGYSHDHYEPEITELPDPVPAVGEWIAISGAVLPEGATAEEMYAEGVYDHYRADTPELQLVAKPLEKAYVYHFSDHILTKLLDIPMTMASNSVYYTYCVTEDGRVLQLSHEGEVLNTLYTAQDTIRGMDHANGYLYILDGDSLIQLDIPAMRYRVLLEQTNIIEMSAWEDPGMVYFCVARGLHYQQYFFYPDTGVLEQTHFL